MSELESISSSGLGKIIETRSKIIAKGSSLKLCCLSEKNLNLMQKNKLDTILKIFKTQKEAIESFKGESDGN